MTQELMTGNAAVAWAARLADVDYVPAFPITPQTEIIETLAAWAARGEIGARLVTLESEHSMVTAAGAAAATGARVFSATSSQGLLYAMEMLYTVAGWRAPFVLVNVSRGLSSPITLEPDHNDVLAARDSGFLQIHAATCQEALDSTLMAFRLAEHPRVRLPVVVNLDGFYLSFTREPVEVPSADQARRFLPAFDRRATRFSAGSPASQGVAVLGGSPYSYFRYQVHLTSLAALDVHEEIAEEFAGITGRRYSALDLYRADDAELVYVMMGSFSTKARAAVDALRDAGWRIGLVRPRLIRPFPAEAFQRALRGKSGVIVVDQNLSAGLGGVLHAELSQALFGAPGAPRVLASFVGGLGGRDIAPEELYEMARVTRQAVAAGRAPAPRLLYTRSEAEQVAKLQAIAHARERGGAP